jgi:hypothetical protein
MNQMTPKLKYIDKIVCRSTVTSLVNIGQAVWTLLRTDMMELQAVFETHQTRGVIFI